MAYPVEPANLLLKTIPGRGGNVYVLCDRDGIPLPNQQAVSVDMQCDDVPRLTVKFFIDGEKIRIAESK